MFYQQQNSEALKATEIKGRFIQSTLLRGGQEEGSSVRHAAAAAKLTVQGWNYSWVTPEEPGQVSLTQVRLSLEVNFLQCLYTLLLLGDWSQ